MHNPKEPRPLSLRIGTRGSPLALWQANHVAERLRAAAPGLEVTIQVIKTAAEKFPDRPAEAIGVGIFTKEIDEELLAGRVDLAVHSMKDIPSETHPELTIACVPEREAPFDAFIGAPGSPALPDLPAGSTIGTGSPRRKAQILHRRPDLRIVPIRGNVDTRLRKVREEGFAGTILARAGLHRLGKEAVISHDIPVDWLVPAVAQGAIAISTRADRRDVIALLASLEHAPTRIRITAERGFLARLRGGCQVPAGALAEIVEGGGRSRALRVTGVVASPDGKDLHRAQVEGDPSQAEALGRRLADELLARGGKAILEAMRGARFEGSQP
jgi:hydroxymethylbilane synthase